MSGTRIRLKRKFASLLVALVVFLTFSLSVSSASSAVNAFYLNTVPTDYAAAEKLFRSLKNGGANTIILRPIIEQGRINKNALANNVYLAHQAGLSMFVIIPTRGMAAALDEHPEWEDVRYFPGNGALLPAGKLDLFNPHVIVYLTDFFKDIASYSVDGILLDEDFCYSDMEGMSQKALERYRRKFRSSFNPGKELAKTVDSEIHEIQSYGEGFWSLARLKNDILLLLLKNIMQSSQAVNKKVKIGIPLHITSFAQAKEQFAWFAYDMAAFKTMNVDLYWAAIPHREIRAQQNLSYQKSMEVLSRTVQSVINIMNDPSKIVFAVQTTSSSGDLLPNSEIEEAIEMVKHAGEPGIAFMINSGTIVPAVLTKKTFNRL